VRPVRALSHAIDVLEALAANGEMGVSEIGREIELSKTAVYNILGTFEVRRMVNRDPVTSRYRLGWRLYELGAELQRHSELAPVARPLLKQLAERTGETVLCAILDRIGVTYVDRVESDHAIRMVAAPGRQSALHATASGMVLLAHQPQAFVDEVLAGELRRFTAQTIVDPGELREELRRVVERGWAECIGEHEPEICSVAVPVRDYSGSVCAAVTVAAPATRMDETARRAATAAALEVARDLSVALGARQDALPAPA
jgi:DNA-binding IclR family transcriptional regulator